MTMTKAEREKVSTLEDDLRLARSLRWPLGGAPEPMTADAIQAARIHAGKEMDRLALGYFMNEYSMRVTRGCSNGTNHNTNGVSQTTSQGIGLMYRTEAEAWRAMLHKKVREVAAVLASIENKIVIAEGCPDEKQEATE